MFAKIFFYSAVLIIAFLGYRHFSAAPNTPKLGTKAPDFNLPNTNGELVNLASFKGNWVVLYFYPRDDSPVCTKQACAFRDVMHKLEKLGAKVVGISVDDKKSHADFAAKYSLPFSLLSDTDGAAAKQYGALSDFLVIKMAKRYTFLIDNNGVLQKTYFSIDTSKHSLQIINDLMALQQSKA